MAISFNAATTASANTSATCNVPLPAGVLAGDVMLMVINLFTQVSSAPTIAFSGAGGTWTLVPTTDASANPQVSSGGTFFNYGYAYYRVATAADAGATLTLTETGSPAGSTWFAVAMAAYTGASTGAPVDVAGGTSTPGNTSPVNILCPALTTTKANDWGVLLFGGATSVTNTTSLESGSVRANLNASSAGISAALGDTNAPVASGGTIGNKHWNVTGTPNWLTAFTIGLAVQPPPSPPLVDAGTGDETRGMARKKWLLGL